MSSALAFLLLRSLRGRIVRMARRLREPRYLLGFLVGIGWTGLWVGRFLFRGRPGSVRFGAPPELVEALAGPLGQVAQIGLCLVLLQLLILWWLVPFGRNSFEFTEAELHLLLPAPVPRRRLIQYGILRSQPGVVLGAAIMTFFSGPGSVLTILGRFAGVWIFLSIWDLHAKGRALWLAQLRELPAAVAWRRRALVWGGLGLLWLALVVGVYGLVLETVATLPRSQVIDATTVLDLLETFGAHAWEGLVGWLLTPMIWLTDAYFVAYRQAGVAATLFAYAVPLVVLVAHNEWVVRSRTRFEEAALDHAKRKSRKVDPAARFWRRSDRTRGWTSFPLRSEGAPEVGLVWANLMLSTRLPLRYQVLAGALALGGLLLACALGGVPTGLVGAIQVFAVAVFLVPPLISGRSLRNDLRANLLKLELLKPLPVSGWRFFAAQVGAPVLMVMMQSLAGAALVIGLDLLITSGLETFLTAPRAQLASFLQVPDWLAVPLLVASTLPLALATALLSTSLENLAALVFPSWMQLGISKKQAASRFGQHIIVFFALSLAMLAGLAPGLLLVAGVVAVQLGIWGAPLTGWEIPILGFMAAAPVGAVVAALVSLGGGMWDRLDPSQELLSEGN